MWLAYAILVPDDVQNFMRRATVELFERYGSNYSSIVVPPHITIKQPFEAELEPSERYFDRLAAETDSFEIVLRGWATFPGDEGVVFLDVEQDPRLFALQRRVLDELGVEPAPHESGEPTPYHFHGTVALGLDA